MRTALLLFLTMAGTATVTLGQTSTAPTPLSPNDSLYQHIMMLERERLAAYGRKDVDYLANAFADEYLETNHHGGTTNKQQELDFYGTADFTLDSGEVGDFTMRRYGDLVVATGAVTWNGAIYKNTDLSGSYRVTRIYVLRDGRWQLATSHASRISKGG